MIGRRPPDRLAGKVALVTGAAGGIGAALSRRLVAVGARVAAVDVDLAALDRLTAELGDRCLAIGCDIRDPDGCARAVATAGARWGGIDLLINNAGVSHHSRFTATDPAVLERVMDVNFWGAVHMTRAALGPLIARRGVIVVMSSVAGFAPLIDRSGYSAAKHALHGMFETLGAELRGDGVSVLMVCPGFVRTEMDRRALSGTGATGVAGKRVVGKLLDPDRVAAEILDAARRRRRRLVPSAVAKASMVLSALAPGIYERLMARSVARSRV